MQSERPITREESVRFRDALQQLFAGPAAPSSVAFAGVSLHVEPTAAGYCLLRSPETRSWRLYPPAPEAPQGYPSNLPFIANEVVTLEADAANWSMTWWAPRECEGVLNRLRELFQNDGAELLQQEGTTEAGTLRLEYRTASGAQRIIMGSAGNLAAIHRDSVFAPRPPT